MLSDLEKKLSKFKNLTIELIALVEKDNFDSIDELLNERQLIIEEIKGCDYEHKEFVQIVSKIQILDYDRKLTELIKEKKLQIKNKLVQLNKSRRANNNYNKNIYRNIEIFNKVR